MNKLCADIIRLIIIKIDDIKDVVSFISTNKKINKVSKNNNLWEKLMFKHFNDKFIKKGNDVIKYRYYETGELYDILKWKNNNNTSNFEYIQLDDIQCFDKKGKLIFDMDYIINRRNIKIDSNEKKFIMGIFNIYIAQKTQRIIIFRNLIELRNELLILNKILYPIGSYKADINTIKFFDNLEKNKRSNELVDLVEILNKNIIAFYDHKGELFRNYNYSIYIDTKFHVLELNKKIEIDEFSYKLILQNEEDNIPEYDYYDARDKTYILVMKEDYFRDKLRMKRGILECTEKYF